MQSKIRPYLYKILKAFTLAIGFLTVMPVINFSEPFDDKDFARASGFYPIGGLIVGLGVSLVWLLGHALHLGSQVAAALSLGTWLAMTGMLHFDGLLDSADGIFASKPPTERLNIMKDVHVGAFAFGTGAVYVLLKFALLAQMSIHTWWWPVLAAVTARGLVVLPMQFYPPARQTGLGTLSRGGWWPLALGFTLLLLFLPLGWVALAGAGVSTWLVAAFCASRLGGGLTGDCYGACIELTEVGVLLALTIATAH